MGDYRYLAAFTTPGITMPPFVNVGEAATGHVKIFVRGDYDPKTLTSPHASITLTKEEFKRLLGELRRNWETRPCH